MSNKNSVIRRETNINGGKIIQYLKTPSTNIVQNKIIDPNEVKYKFTLTFSDREITNWQQKYDQHLFELAAKQKQWKEINDKEIDQLKKELKALEVQMAYNSSPQQLKELFNEKKKLEDLQNIYKNELKRLKEEIKKLKAKQTTHVNYLNEEAQIYTYLISNKKIANDNLAIKVRTLFMLFLNKYTFYFLKSTEDILPSKINAKMNDIDYLQLLEIYEKLVEISNNLSTNNESIIIDDNKFQAKITNWLLYINMYTCHLKTAISNYYGQKTLTKKYSAHLRMNNLFLQKLHLDDSLYDILQGFRKLWQPKENNYIIEYFNNFKVNQLALTITEEIKTQFTKYFSLTTSFFRCKEQYLEYLRKSYHNVLTENYHKEIKHLEKIKSHFNTHQIELIKKNSVNQELRMKIDLITDKYNIYERLIHQFYDFKLKATEIAFELFQTNKILISQQKGNNWFARNINTNHWFDFLPMNVKKFQQEQKEITNKVNQLFQVERNDPQFHFNLLENYINEVFSELINKYSCSANR
ncbi:hypothetical protein [Spiroplasma sp. DGKH1]|uniref:hypothetical protein n=1 Tax=Spiroplasma sp. DGKH1 TaxID=3050074 RepID=UPI0034C68CC1